jgi:toxin ParE1/3/4
MARVELAPEVGEDFERILDFQVQNDAANAAEPIVEIMRAIDVLAYNPMIGRLVSNGKRELVIGRKGRGFVALYRYVEEIDAVFVLAVRSQRRC